MKIKVKQDKDGNVICPHCLQKTKFVYVAEFICNGKYMMALRCANCKRIVWGK